MGNYIKSINHKPITTKNSWVLITYYWINWKEYKLGELFKQIYNAEAHVKNDIDYFGYTNNDRIEFITRTDTNNGCDCYVIKMM